MKLDNDILDEGWNPLSLEKNAIEGRFNKECLASGQERVKDHTDHGQTQLGPIGFNHLEKSAIERHIDSQCKMKNLEMEILN
jgi:hypothetical protein